LHLSDLAKEYAKRWRLTGLRPTIQTLHSHLYTCQVNRSDNAFLKILTDKGSEIESGGFELLSCYGVHNAVPIFAFDHRAAVMLRLEGPQLLDKIDQGQANIATEIQIDLSMRLISTRSKPDNLKSLTDILTPCMSMATESIPGFARNIIEAAQSVTQPILTDQTNWTALHGDLHPRNIMYHNRQWLAIDARGIMGPQAFEFANLFINPWDRQDLIFSADRMEKIALMISQKLGCDRETIIRCALLNCLFYAEIQFQHGRGKYPVKCMEMLLRLL